mmetsp:Transcript_22516/g.47284  ORF Transcript_22516/g.47284 Transcript_22516/m.47284 type:complete len:83 (-) Transcript_22516:2842-3090(-)
MCPSVLGCGAAGVSIGGQEVILVDGREDLPATCQFSQVPASLIVRDRAARDAVDFVNDALHAPPMLVDSLVARGESSRDQIA